MIHAVPVHITEMLAPDEIVCVVAPSIVSDPSPSTVIVPVPLFLIIKVWEIYLK